jgi:hypothetical protein
MKLSKFRLKENLDGTWDVVETDTGLTLECMGPKLSSVSQQEAHDWLSLMLIRARLQATRKKETSILSCRPRP